MVSRESGFTLVEIVIVLLIIGLLLGGALKSGDLIFDGKVKATFHLARDVSSAFNAYLDRYGQMPGDDTAAPTHFPGTVPAPLAGNGDGVLSFGDCAGSTSHAENCQALYHLRLAGLLPGSGAAPIAAPFGGLAFPASGSSVVPSFGSSPVLAFAPNSLTQQQASAIDAAFDDGDPATGLFRCAGMREYESANPNARIGVYCALSL